MNKKSIGPEKLSSNFTQLSQNINNFFGNGGQLLNNNFTHNYLNGHMLNNNLNNQMYEMLSKLNRQHQEANVHAYMNQFNQNQMLQYINNSIQHNQNLMQRKRGREEINRGQI
jgi:hypothetical protein